MTTKIWTAGTCLKKDIFTKLLDIFQMGGWTILTPNPVTATAINLYSPGIDGNKKIYLRLRPYDGNSYNATYDIRTTEYTDFTMEFGTAYNAATDTVTPVGKAEIFSFLAGRDASLSYSDGRKYNRDWEMRYWYYVDRDRLIFMSQPSTGFSDLLKSYTTMNFVGIPEVTYLQERVTPVYSCTVLAKTHTAFADNKLRVVERPLSLLAENNNSSNSVYVMKAEGSSPNADNIVELSEVYFGGATEGVRGMLGGFYVTPTGLLLDGDTVEVQDITGTHTYLYKIMGPTRTTNSYSSFPNGTGILIRIS